MTGYDVERRMAMTEKTAEWTPWPPVVDTAWPKVLIAMPEGAEAKMLRYWIGIWTPRDGVWLHPDDRKKHKKLIKKAKYLLEEFFE